MLKQLSYSGHPIALTVKIHGQVIPDHITAVDDILRGVDYPNLTEFRIGEASVTLRDIHGDFSPNNDANFFTQHGGRRTGRNSPVEIEAGFIVDGTLHTATLFKGIIIRLVQDAKAATVKAICADGVGGLRSDALTDFGIARHFMLVEALNRTGENGFYPVMDAVMPASQGSPVLATRTGEAIAPVQKLKTEGTLNPRNYVVDAEGVSTEGGFIVNRQVGYPQLRMKSPYRYRHIKDIIADILNHAGITDSEIEIPEHTVDPHFSSNGRVNYNLIGNIGSSNPVTWNGYVTDFLRENVTTYAFPANPVDNDVVIFCNAASGLENYFERLGTAKTTARRGDIAQYDAAQSRWEHHSDLISTFSRINSIGKITIINAVGDIPSTPSDGDVIVANAGVTVSTGVYVNINGAARTTINRNVVAQWVQSENLWHQRGNIQNIVTTLGTIARIRKEVERTEGDKWYFLYNKHRNNPNGFSQITVYDEATRTETKLHGFSSATEVWKFTKFLNTFYILATTGGNYDANESSCETQIIQVGILSGSQAVFVPHTVNLRPQLAHYYAGVGSVHHKPDSRRQLIYRENDGLYYAYVNSANGEFGVAKATNPNIEPTAVVSVDLDNYENHAGIGFDINASGVLSGGTTFVSGGRSQTLVFKKAL